MTRRDDALIELLSRPDEPCLRRGHRVTQPASPFLDPEAIKRDLGAAYVEWRRQDHADISCVVGHGRRAGRLQIVRRA